MAHWKSKHTAPCVAVSADSSDCSLESDTSSPHATCTSAVSKPRRSNLQHVLSTNLLQSLHTVSNALQQFSYAITEGRRTVNCAYFSSQEQRRAQLPLVSTVAVVDTEVASWPDSQEVESAPRQRHCRRRRCRQTTDRSVDGTAPLAQPRHRRQSRQSLRHLRPTSAVRSTSTGWPDGHTRALTVRYNVFLQ